MRIASRVLALACLLPLVALAQGKTVKIGVLNDQSGLYTDLGGPGSVVAAKMAAEEFGNKVAGMPIEVVFADHQNKPDIGSGIATKWIDVDGVDVIVDVPNSGVALAIARILRTGARLLLLDEPTEGLAPVIVQQIGATIRRLKAEGFTILLVEQNLKFAASIADRHYVMDRGRVVDEIPAHRFESSMPQLQQYLGV